MTETIVSARGPTVNACLAKARLYLSVVLKDTREKFRSGGEDGLYRVHLHGNIIVECTVVQHSRAEV